MHYEIFNCIFISFLCNSIIQKWNSSSAPELISCVVPLLKLLRETTWMIRKWRSLFRLELEALEYLNLRLLENPMLYSMEEAQKVCVVNSVVADDFPIEEPPRTSLSQLSWKPLTLQNSLKSTTPPLTRWPTLEWQIMGRWWPFPLSGSLYGECSIVWMLHYLRTVLTLFWVELGLLRTSMTYGYGSSEVELELNSKTGVNLVAGRLL